MEQFQGETLCPFFVGRGWTQKLPLLLGLHHWMKTGGVHFISPLQSLRSNLTSVYFPVFRCQIHVATGVKSFDLNISWFCLFVWHSVRKGAKNVWTVTYKWFQNFIFFVKALWKIYLILCWQLSVINLDNKRSQESPHSCLAHWFSIQCRVFSVVINISYYYQLIILFSWLRNSWFGVTLSEWWKIPIKNYQSQS